MSNVIVIGRPMHIMASMASLHLRYKILGLMIMASHRTFLAKISICPANSILARQIYYTLSMEISLSLFKIMNVRTFGPYHKHWDIHIRIIPATIAHPCQYTGMMENLLLYYLGAQPSLVSIIARYKQTSKSLPGTSLPTSMKTTQQTICMTIHVC